MAIFNSYVKLPEGKKYLNMFDATIQIYLNIIKNGLQALKDTRLSVTCWKTPPWIHVESSATVLHSDWQGMETPKKIGQRFHVISH
jgi:hypothetical protein